MFLYDSLVYLVPGKYFKKSTCLVHNGISGVHLKSVHCRCHSECSILARARYSRDVTQPPTLLPVQHVLLCSTLSLPFI